MLTKAFKVGRHAVRAFSASAPAAPPIGVEIDDNGIALVTMQWNPHNIFTYEAANTFHSVLLDLKRTQPRGIILTSAFSKVFTAGLDLSMLRQPRYDEYKSWWLKLQDIFVELYGSSAPTVAAITGYSAGFGTLLACSCEHRIMVDSEDNSSVLGYHEVLFGFNPPPWFLMALVNVVPRRIAELASLQGKLFLPKEAFNIGLIDELASDKEDVVRKSKLWLTKSSHPSSGRGVTKRLLRAEAINYVKENRQKDLYDSFGHASSAPYQNNLSDYLMTMKRKDKANK